MIRPSILRSRCSKSHIWMRAFCTNSQPKQKKAKISSKTSRPIKEQTKSSKPRRQNHSKWPKIRTYTLKKPENQVLAAHEPEETNKKESDSEWPKKVKQTLEKIVNILRKESNEVRAYNRLGHNPLNFGACHGCCSAKFDTHREREKANVK